MKSLACQLLIHGEFLFLSFRKEVCGKASIAVFVLFGIKKDLEKNWELGNITDKRSYEINRNET